MNAKIVKTFPHGKTLKAVANVTIEDDFVVHGVKVINSDNGLFVAMPSTKIGEQFKDICHPINSETRQRMTEIVLAAYSEVVPAN